MTADEEGDHDVLDDFVLADDDLGYFALDGRVSGVEAADAVFEFA